MPVPVIVLIKLLSYDACPRYPIPDACPDYFQNLHIARFFSWLIQSFS